MNIESPLSEKELDLLDDFLLDRIDEGADTEGKDEGILCVSELDGFLTAIVSGPSTLVPSRWLPVLWGDLEPIWSSVDEYQTIMSLIMRHSNGIVSMLMSAPEDFEPLFNERRIENRTITIVDEWCEGYMRGVGIDGDVWMCGGQYVDDRLSPIRAFTEETGWAAHDLEDPKAREALCASISSNARSLHAYWISKRTTPQLSSRQKGVRVGRNDPCPCGSGKKFKKCCLH